jgi:cation transport ATPase
MSGRAKYQFMNLSVTNGLTVDEIRNILTAHNAVQDMIDNADAYIEASKKFGISEVYLLAHSGLESGWGSSQLAGSMTGPNTGRNIYNLYGIAAFNDDGSRYQARKYAEDNGLVISEVEDFQMIPGKGVKAALSNKIVACGNTLYIKENSITETGKMQNILANLRNQGKASIIVAENGKAIGIIALSDTIRPTAKNLVAKLGAMDTDVVLLTGDNHLTAKYMAEQVGIKNIRADLLPAQKVSSIENLQKKNKIVCMIGDGVNDAPALKMANVSVAMGSMGSDIAIEAADIALMSDNIDKIPYLKRLSNATLRTIKGNITASMGINAVAIVLSVLGLLNPITGALVHNAGSVLVVLNAALLYDRNFDH